MPSSSKPPRKQSHERLSVQVQLRFSAEEIEQLQRVVREANDQASSMGLPRNVTLSALIRLWVAQRLRTYEHGRQEKIVEGPTRYSTSSTLAALDKLREAREPKKVP